MPELPDLLYIKEYLDRTVKGRTIRSVTVEQPVILRNTFDRAVEELLQGASVLEIGLRGPFIRCALSGSREIVINLMLAGRLQLQQPGDKAAGYRCMTLMLDNGVSLHICDEKKMAKVYLVRPGEYAAVPKYAAQGLDILSPAFTIDAFRSLARAHKRRQVRVFINDQTALSAIGNAYADEILFEARVHPKTFVGTLTPATIERLYRAIHDVISWGTAEVIKAAEPIHVKVRGHMKVRNRRGEACPRCGTTLRREGVRGHDVFFCPSCQPASRSLFIDWEKETGEVATKG